MHYLESYSFQIIDQIASLAAVNEQTCVEMQEGEKSFLAAYFDRSQETTEAVKGAVASWLPIVKDLFGAASIVPLPETGIIGYISTLFGRKRFERISERAGIDLRYRNENFLTRWELEAFFVHAAEVFEEDLQELLSEVRDRDAKIRFLSEDDSILYRKEFGEAGCLNDCSKEQFEKLFSLLIPYKSIDALFSKSVSRHQSTDIWNRVSLYEKIYHTPLSESQWMMLVAKKALDQRLTAGIVFRNCYGGFCKVHQVVSAAGAHKCFLKHIGKQQVAAPNIVAYRGMSWRDLSSVYEGFRGELGSKGSQATFEETKQLLTNPERGFVSHKDENVIGVGMSLGTCHLTCDSVLFASKFRRVVLFAGPGLELGPISLYSALTGSEPEPEKRRRIEHWWEADDVTHLLGEAHLGYGCDFKKVKVVVNILDTGTLFSAESIAGNIQRIAEVSRFPSHENSDNEAVQGILALKSALDGPHGRYTLGQDHSHVRLDSDKEPELTNMLLGHDSNGICDPKWKELRKKATISGDAPFVDYALEKIAL